MNLLLLQYEYNTYNRLCLRVVLNYVGCCTSIQSISKRFKIHYLGLLVGRVLLGLRVGLNVGLRVVGRAGVGLRVVGLAVVGIDDEGWAVNGLSK